MTRDSFVTIGLPNGIEFFEATIAVWKLGATPQPISSRLPAAERHAIIELANPSLVVGVDRSETPGRTTVPAGFTPGSSLSSDPLPAVIARRSRRRRRAEAPDRPKLIVATQTATWEAVAGFATLLRMQQNGVHLVTGPLYHNGPFTSSVLALLSGNHLVVMPRFDAARALALIEQHRVDWMYAVPTMMHRIWRLPEERAPPVRPVEPARAVPHGGPVSRVAQGGWIEWLGGERVLELYGGHGGSVDHRHLRRRMARRTGARSGAPCSARCAVLDADGRELPPGQVGEIWMRRGADVPTPYRYVGAAAKSRPGNWESLGDLGWQDESGYIYLSDRETDMILVGGANVYPAEVEAALDEHPQVISSCVIGLPDDDYGNVVHAIVQARRAARELRARRVPAFAAGDVQAAAHVRVRGDAVARRRRQGPADGAPRRAPRPARVTCPRRSCRCPGQRWAGDARRPAL